MSKDKKENHVKEVHKEEPAADSFRMYPASDEGTKIVDGEKAIDSFHLYKEDNEDKD